MFNGRFGIGRVYKKLPQHQNAKELGDNIEVLANFFLDRACRNGLSVGPVPWDWRLASDLKDVVEFMRAFVPDDTYIKYAKGLDAI